MKHVKRQHKKLLLELKFLHADLEYHEIVFEDAKSAFSVGLRDFLKRHNLHGQFNDYQNKNAPESTEIKVRTNVDSDAKDFYSADIPDNKIKDKELSKLFKEIAIKTHPDKISKATSPGEKAQKIDMFLDAKRSAEQGDWFKLQEIAMSLGIPIPPPTANQIKLLHSRIDEIKKKINKMVNTFAWKWNDLESNKNKDALMKQYVKIAFKIDISF
tara:strand:- start:422 stop:1063 length:642 start_codon:yes stop_codon:yes gene_type:complete